MTLVRAIIGAHFLYSFKEEKNIGLSHEIPVKHIY
jgi:hypothetical protein